MTSYKVVLELQFEHEHEEQTRWEPGLDVLYIDTAKVLASDLPDELKSDLPDWLMHTPEDTWENLNVIVEAVKHGS